MTYLPRPGQVVLDEHGRARGRVVAVRRTGGVVVMDDGGYFFFRDFYTGRYRPDRHTPPDAPHEVACIRDAAMLRHGSTWADYLPFLRRSEEFRDRRVRVWAEMRGAGLSYPQIAAAFGLAHTTVLTALQRAKRQGVGK